MTDETPATEAPAADAPAETSTEATTETPAVDAAPAQSTTEDEAKAISLLSERLHFFFSSANLRQDKWMRTELANHGALSLDTLLKFHTIKSISSDKGLLARAAKGETTEGDLGERVKKLIVFNEERGEVRRVVPFDFKTMGDGSALSLWVKNIPLTKPEAKDGAEGEAKNTEGDDKEEGKEGKYGPADGNKFKPRYACSRDEVKALFEPYGRVAIVNLRYGRKQSEGNGRWESYPMGAAVVEFEDEEGIGKAIADLLPQESETKEDEMKVDGEEKEANGKEKAEKGEPKTVLELKGNKLSVRKMEPMRFFQKDNNDNGKNKRSRDDNAPKDSDAPKDNGAPGDGDNDKPQDVEEAVEFEPVTLDWEKGCIISLSGLSSEKCDRESIREAVSDILGVSKDVKASGLYVDYNRGETEGNLRMKDASKADKMKELVEKIVDGTVTIAGEKVQAKVLEGEDEEKYWEKFTEFLNNRKRQKEEEKAQKRRRFSGGRGGRGGGRGGRRGRGGRGRR